MFYSEPDLEGAGTVPLPRAACSHMLTPKPQPPALSCPSAVKHKPAVTVLGNKNPYFVLVTPRQLLRHKKKDMLRTQINH